MRCVRSRGDCCTERARKCAHARLHIIAPPCPRSLRSGSCRHRSRFTWRGCMRGWSIGRTATLPRIFPSSRRPTQPRSASSSRLSTATSTKSAPRASSSRFSRSRNRWRMASRSRIAGGTRARSGRRRTQRRRVQFDQPAAGQRPAVESDDQRRRDRDVVTGRRRDERSAADAHDRCDLGVRGPRAVDRRRGVRVGTARQAIAIERSVTCCAITESSAATRSRRWSCTSSSVRFWSTAATSR